ncbi:MAG: tetratricopeptide repeat protein [Deltaproteobacteria bacterium]|nr:tetratricopeptide repeat protein [Deltaproteobacteria bacterium]
MTNKIAHPLLLISALTMAHINSLPGTFQFDDYNVIVNNSLVHSWSAWLADLPHGIRPFLKLTYTFNWTMGWGAFGFHLFNLAVHAGNTLLVYAIAGRILREQTAALSKPGTQMAAFLAALLFAVHPVQTEAVTYICGRSTSLMAFFYLAGFYAYQCGVEENRGVLIYLAGPVLFVMAILTKEVAVTLPAALLLWEACRRDRGQDKGKPAALLRRQGIYWLLLGVLLAAMLYHPRYWGLLEFSAETRPLRQNILSQINGICYLVSRFLWLPGLNIDPDLPVISRWTPLLSLQAATLIFTLVLGMVAVKKKPWLGFGILWFFLHLLPTNSIIPRLDIANERQLYLSGVGLYLLAGQGANLLYERMPQGKSFVRWGLALVFFVLIATTIQRNHAYQNEIALWQDTVQKSPHKARVYNNLGYAFFLAGRYGEAREAYTVALRIRPDWALPRNNLTAIETALKRRKL